MQGLYDKDGLIKARRNQKRKFYNAELRRFVSAVLLVFAVTTAFVLALGVNKSSQAIVFYAIGTFGYGFGQSQLTSGACERS